MERRTGDHAITNDTTKDGSAQTAEQASAGPFCNWFDPVESALRDRVRGFIEELIQDELEEMQARTRYARRANEADGVACTTGHRYGSRQRTLTGTFGKSKITVPRTRLHTAEGKAAECESTTPLASRRCTLSAEALIASTYLAGTKTRRVWRALAALFGGAVGKDTVSRT